MDVKNNTSYANKHNRLAFYHNPYDQSGDSALMHKSGTILTVEKELPDRILSPIKRNVNEEYIDITLVLYEP